MAVLSRTVMIVEGVMFAVLFIFLVVMAIDLISAWQALPCGSPNAQANCYPWGATEGPSANIGWHYENKRNYMASSIFVTIVLVLALSLGILLPSGRKIAALVVAIGLIATSNYYLPLFFGPG